VGPTIYVSDKIQDSILAAPTCFRSFLPSRDLSGSRVLKVERFPQLCEKPTKKRPAGTLTCSIGAPLYGLHRHSGSSREFFLGNARRNGSRMPGSSQKNAGR
jgi:hypothetical protein